ncbi:MAG: hypothetical protein QE263_04640 [Vampirovibrionales bacterium]|nr:hypothetical protein [Vampirovibrionales bacterium]
MSGGKSNSKSTSTTTTTTQQTDERVAATDMGVAIGANANVSGLTIQQLPEELGPIANKLLDTQEMLINIASQASEKAITQTEDAQADSAKNVQRLVLIGVVAVVVIVIALRKK